MLLMVRRGRPRAIARMTEHFAEPRAPRARRGARRDPHRAARWTTRSGRAVSERLAELTGDKIEINEVVDEALIGGITVRIGDRLYDASVRSRLERLRARLTAV